MHVFYGLTDVGRRRSLNEDTIYAQDDLFIVCDGMGGHKAGEVASALAVETIAGFIRRSAQDPEFTWPFGYDIRLSHEENRLATAVKLANLVVHRKGSSIDEYTGMGTTVVAALVSRRRGQMAYTHVGDSRLYLIRDGATHQLTRDDTWAGQAWSEEPDAAASAMKHVLTKALGAREDVDFETAAVPLRDGDIVLLCSDGLTNMLPDARIRDIVLARDPDVAAGCQDLIAHANAEGGHDNVSVILVRHGG
jgi:protein phosphatase